MSLFKSGVSWFRRTFDWSNSWPSWQERLVLTLFLLIAIGLAFLSAFIPFWQAILLWALYATAVTVGSRQGWLQLFGPVLFYDMIRTARRSRYVLMRLFYAGLLLFVLCFQYLNIVAQRETRGFFYGVLGYAVFVLVLVGLVSLLRVVTSLYGRLAILALIALGFVLFSLGFAFLNLDEGQPVSRRQTAELAESFFAVFMSVQLAMVVFLTPAYVAGSIAEEKERKTLEFMLATDLNNHEIVLSKLLSRLANIALFLLTGLPILSILQFLGGVDVQLMLLGFVGTALTMLGVASVSMLFSTLLQKPRDAVGLTYLSLIAYAAFATVGKVMALVPGLWIMHYPVWFGESGPTLAEASHVVNAGNPIAAIIDINVAIRSASLATRLPDLLTDYAWFQGILSAVCIFWSIVRLRTIALKQTVAGTTKKLGWWARNRPAIGELPMIWKELQIEGSMKLNWAGWIAVGLLVLLTVGSGLFIVGAYIWAANFADPPPPPGFWHRLPSDMNIWFRIAGTGVICLMLLRVSVHASTAITGERERDTFDSLLTTPLSAEAILGAKLLGCVASLRMGSVWFGCMMVLAVLTLGLHPLAVPILIVAFFVYAIFFSMIGLWFSMICKSSMRATVLTVLTTLFLAGGHWLLMGLCCYFPFATLTQRGPSDLEYVVKFQIGMTPPVVIGFCAYSWDDLAQNFRWSEFRAIIPFCFLGLFLWAMGCLFLWYGLLLPKFRAITRREELIYK